MPSVNDQGRLLGRRKGAEDSVLGHEQCRALELLKHELDGLLATLQPIKSPWITLIVMLIV